MARSRLWLAPAIVYAAVIVVFAVWSPDNLWQFPLDDAWIHRVYARSFAWGHGFAYNDAQEAGSTSPLWAILTAPVHWLEPLLGVDAVVAAVKLIGAALGALSVAAVHRLGRQLSNSAWPAALAASLFACEPSLAFSALSGMEVSLVVCLWLWLIVALHAERWRLAAVLLGLLPVARPEAVLLAGLAVVVLAVTRRRRLIELMTLWSIAWCIVPTALWLGFCELATGHLLPNTYYVKASGEVSLQSLTIALGLLVQRGWAQSIGLPILEAAMLIAWLVRHRARGTWLALLAIGSLAFVIAVVMTRSLLPLGYYWTRWTDPGVLGVAAACALGVALGLHALIASNLARRVRIIAAAAVSLAVLAALPGVITSLAERAERLGSDSRVIERMNVEPGRWIAANTPADAVLGVNDAGAIRYFGGRTTIDLLGLNAADIAFHRSSRDAIEQRVDWLAIYPVMLKLYPAFSLFDRQHEFSIPPEQYTICDCTGPTEMFIARRSDHGAFTAEQRQAMIAVLRDQPAGTLAWLAAPHSDPVAMARADELRKIFGEAGWQVAPVQYLPFQPRQRLLLLAADDQPPPSVATVRAAFDAAGLAVELRTGYRAYYDRQRASGSRAPLIELAPDLTFVLVVGHE